MVLSLEEAELFLDTIARVGDGELERLARLMRALQHAHDTLKPYRVTLGLKSLTRDCTNHLATFLQFDTDLACQIFNSYVIV